MLNKAFNAIKSTLKGPAMSQMKSGAMSGLGSLSGATGIRSMGEAKSYGKGIMNRFNNSTGMQKAGMAGSYAGAGMAGAAATDFLNPWGLGWGD